MFRLGNTMMKTIDYLKKNITNDFVWSRHKDHFLIRVQEKFSINRQTGFRVQTTFEFG